MLGGVCFAPSVTQHHNSSLQGLLQCQPPPRSQGSVHLDDKAHTVEPPPRYYDHFSLARTKAHSFSYPKTAYGTLRNETKRNGTLRNGTLRNGYNTMLHHTLSRVPRIPLKAEDLFPKSNVLPDAILDLGDLERCV